MASMGVCFDGDLDLFPSYGKLAGMDQGGYSPGPLEGSWGRPFTHWTLAWSSKTGGHAHMRAHELVTHREGSAWIRGDLESDGVVINRDL